MTRKAEAVEALVELGLTEYEARCFVALTQLSKGTAKEISRLAEVPQSRVYDVAEQLHRRGLVDVQASEPRRYSAVPVDDALDRLEREYVDTLEIARDRLLHLDTRDTDGGGVWAVASGEDVVARIASALEGASDEVYVAVADAALLDGPVLDALAAASERGVPIYAELPSEAAAQRLREGVPAANVALSPLPLPSLGTGDREPGRLVMVDRETVLVSALREGLVPDDVEETGLWASDVGHGLVLWLRPLLVERLERIEFASE